MRMASIAIRRSTTECRIRQSTGGLAQSIEVSGELRTLHMLEHTLKLRAEHPTDRQVRGQLLFLEERYFACLWTSRGLPSHDLAEKKQLPYMEQIMWLVRMTSPVPNRRELI